MFLEEIQGLVSKNHYPLNYNPEEWEKYLNADCYTYALGLEVDEGFMIGDFIGKRVTYHDNPEFQKEIFLEEAIALGFQVEECETEDCSYVPGSFKLYIEWDEDNYYHFIREDSDGGWSINIKENFLIAKIMQVL